MPGSTRNDLAFSRTSGHAATCRVDDIVLNKTAIIERCLQRIDQEYRGRETELTSNQTRQDAILLNLQRACEAVIILAMHEVRLHRLGFPQDSRDAFELLRKADRIDTEQVRQINAMVGFRNIAIHQYQELSVDVVRTILERRLEDFRAFIAIMLRSSYKDSSYLLHCPKIPAGYQS